MSGVDNCMRLISTVLVLISPFAFERTASALTKVSSISSIPSAPPGDKLQELCKKVSVLCVDTDGIALADETAPQLGPGEIVTVVVIGFTDGASDYAITMTPSAAAKPSSNCVKMAAPAATPDQLSEVHFDSLPSAAEVTIDFERVSDCTASAKSVAKRQITISLQRNGYYVEPIFFFPTIFDGIRTARTIPLPDGRSNVVHISNSNTDAITHISLGVNVHPFGYPAGDSIIPFMNFIGKGRPSLTPRGWISNTAGLLAVQLGTSIGVNAFSEYYLGGAVSIVRGVSIGGGVGFTQGEFLGPSVFEGQVLASSVDISKSVQHKWMHNPYFSASLSPEILQTLIDLLKKAQDVFPNSPSGQVSPTQ